MELSSLHRQHVLKGFNPIFKYRNYEYTNSSLKWAEQHLYGSSRIGIMNTAVVANGLASDVYSYTLANDPVGNGIKGKRVYELSNHLGNIMATISDRKIGVDVNSDGQVDYFEAEVLSQSDYYPGGMKMKDRSYGVQGRYGFNGMEKSKELGDDFYEALFWQYDSRIAERWNTDPVIKVYESSYNTFGRNPVWYTDVNGDDKYKINSDGKIHRVKNKDKFDQFFIFKDSDGDGDKEWVQVANFNKNSNGLIQLVNKFRYENWGWNYTGSKGENYISGAAMAGVIGALRNAGEIVSFNHWSAGDGSSPSPSKSHKGGTVGDIHPLRKDRAGSPVLVSDFQFDKEANTKLISAFKLFGWNSVLSEKYNGWITPGTTHYSAARHNNHYHIQRYQPKLYNVSDFNMEPIPSTEPWLRILYLKQLSLPGITLKSGIIFRGDSVIKK